MKRVMDKNVTRNNKSVYRSYFISYFSIVLLSCSIIGIFTSYLAAQDIKKANINNITHKMHLALKDLETQYTIMEDISTIIRIKPQYRTSHFKQNKYYEIELLEDFSRYVNRSSFSSNYFLLYKNDSNLFLSKGNTTNANYYFSSVFGKTDINALYEHLNNLMMKEVLSLKDDGVKLFCFPIDTWDSQDAVLCFVVTERELLQRMDDVTGGISGFVQYYYGNELLASNMNDISPSMDNKNILKEISAKNIFSIRVDPDEHVIYPAFLLDNINILIISLFVILLLGLSTYLAYKNYKPINNLVRKYTEKLNFVLEEFTDARKNSVPQNELRKIDSMFQIVLEKEKRAYENLKSKIALSQHQMLWLILNGEYNDNVQESLESVNIFLPEPFFCVFAIRAANHPDELLTDDSFLLDNIRALNIDGCRLYPVVSMDRKNIITLCNLRYSHLQKDVITQISESYQRDNLDIRIGYGKVYSSLYQVSASCLEALSYCNQDNQEVLAEDVLQYDKELILRVVQAIKAGNAADAKMYMVNFCNNLVMLKPNILLQRFIFSDILGNFVELGRQYQCPLLENQISVILTAHDIENFCREALLIVQYLCQGVNYYLESYNKDFTMRMIKYMQMHCCEYDFSLAKLSSEFRISVTDTSRIIREVTGKVYKDYLIELRIERAKKLLIEKGMSVAETSMGVGYSSTPHFIKLFKKVTGVTPAFFQKNGLEEHGEQVGLKIV